MRRSPEPLRQQRGFLLNPFRFGEPISVGAWNPADMAAGLELSEGNSVVQRVSTAADYLSVRSTVSRSSGKFYFEISLDGPSGWGSTDVYGALCSVESLLTERFVFGSPGGAYVAWRGNKQYGSDAAGFIGSHAGSDGWFQGTGPHWIGLACDLGTRVVTPYIKGVARATASYSSGFGAMFPCACLEGPNSGDITEVRLRVLAADFLGSPPVDYAAWAA